MKGAFYSSIFTFHLSSLTFHPSALTWRPIMIVAEQKPLAEIKALIGDAKKVIGFCRSCAKRAGINSATADTRSVCVHTLAAPRRRCDGK